MTINEFRAWLDGFKEAMGDAPSPEQWAKVLEKLERVHQLAPAVPTVIPNIIGPYWSPSPVWCGPNTSNTSARPFIPSTQIVHGQVSAAKLETFGAPGDREMIYEN